MAARTLEILHHFNHRQIRRHRYPSPIDVTWRIDVDKPEHLELFHKSRSRKTDLHRLRCRRTISAENLVPQRPVGIVVCMHLALMVQNVLLGPLNKIANPARFPHVPVRKQRDEKLEQANDGDGASLKPQQKGALVTHPLELIVAQTLSVFVTDKRHCRDQTAKKV